MRVKGTPSLKEERGQSVVELAFSAVILAFLLLVAADFARVFFTVIAINNATRVGAEYAIDFQVAATLGSAAAADQAVKDRVKAEASPLVSLDDAEISVSAPWTPSTSTQDAVVTVNVQHAFIPVTPFIRSFFTGGQIMIDRTSTLRHNFTAP